MPLLTAAQPSGTVAVTELSQTEMYTTIKEAQAHEDSMTLVFLYNLKSSDDDFKQVNQMAKEYKSRGLVVLPFAIDTKASELGEMLADVKPLNVPAYLVQATLTPLKRTLLPLGITKLTKLPYAALLGKDGKVEKEWVGENQLADCADYLDRFLPQTKSDKGVDTVKSPGDKAAKDKDSGLGKEPAIDPSSLASQNDEKQTPPWVPMLIGAGVAVATLVVGFSRVKK
jgi:hypothetical protein